MKTAKAPISEIFSSIQGEGLYIGERQIFVRFSGCNISCGYCDTDFSPRLNLSVRQILKKIDSLDRRCGPHKSISITGGEPLIHSQFLKVLLKSPLRKKFHIYLETNGTLADELRDIADLIDIIAMDIKLPGALKNADFFKAHKKFLMTARGKEVFIKIVISKNTSSLEFKKALQLIKSAGRKIPLVLQPDYPEIGKALSEKIKKLQAYALKYICDVRVIPQVHKILEIK